MARLPWLFPTRESPGKKHSCRFWLIKDEFPFYIENGILCAVIRMRTYKTLHGKENQEDIHIMPPDLAI